MTNFEIIVQLEDLARDAKGRIDPEDPEDVFRRDYEALTEAVKILNAENKQNHVSRRNAFHPKMG